MQALKLGLRTGRVEREAENSKEKETEQEESTESGVAGSAGAPQVVVRKLALSLALGNKEVAKQDTQEMKRLKRTDDVTFSLLGIRGIGDQA